MPVYKCAVRGEDKPRLVKASTAAQARAHLVKADAATSDELADLIEGGATIEKAAAASE